MRKFVIGILAAALIWSVPSASFAEGPPEIAKERAAVNLDFADAGADYWASESIERMRVKDIFNGYDDGTFRPSKPVTRMQTIVTAVRLLGLEEEAKAKDTDTPVAFTDAENYFGKERNEWAKGYVLVALEQGLFDTNEKTLNPNKPAKRIWVASTLVRALGLEEEALDAMTEELDYEDAAAIPAGAVGYANIADEYEIITGTKDNEFQPNKPITRAQMATVLDRTYDDVLEEQGGTAIQGTLVSHQESDRTLTVETEGEQQDYEYEEDFLILYEERFIQPNQLQEGDRLSLQVIDGTVQDAAILSEEAQEQVGESNVHAAKVEVEYQNDDEFELKFSTKKGKIEAKIEEELENGKREVKGEAALTEVQQYLDAWQLDSSMSTDEIVSTVISSLNRQNDIKEVEVNIYFTNGVKVKHEDERPEEEESEEQPTSGINSLELEAKWTNGKEEKWEYEVEDGEVEAEVERKDNGEEIEWKDNKAISFLEGRIMDLQLSSEQSTQVIIEQLLTEEGWSEDELAELKIEIEFANGVEKEVEWSKDSHDDDEEDEDDDEDEDEE